MLILKPEGLFAGDRVRHCSDAAQLHWPRIFLASNGFARLELNYFKIVGAAYGSFVVKPTQAELESYLLEYINNDLLFPYEHDGQIWAQWDAIQQCLPRFKTAEDLRSPVPPDAAFAEWKAAYYEKKKTSGISELFPKSFRNSSEGFLHVVVGAGVGAVEDVDVKVKNTCAPQDGARDCSATPIYSKRKHPASEVTKEQAEWFDEWWATYWLAKAKQPALKAFAHHVKDRQRFDEVLAATLAQKPGMMKREPEHRPHGATWLNAERWTDSVTDEKRSNAVLDEIYGKLKENW